MGIGQKKLRRGTHAYTADTGGTTTSRTTQEGNVNPRQGQVIVERRETQKVEGQADGGKTKAGEAEQKENCQI